MSAMVVGFQKGAGFDVLPSAILYVSSNVYESLWQHIIILDKKIQKISMNLWSYHSHIVIGAIG